MKLVELIDNEEFIGRHLGSNDKQQKIILKELGYSSIDDFINDCIPNKILSTNVFTDNDSVNENVALNILQNNYANNIAIYKSYLGLGYYPTLMPYVILRNVLENPGWYTSYTPYQAEVSQGRLECLLNFQQMCIDLTGLEVANASLLDEATATAEAMTMSKRVSKIKSNKVFVDAKIYPQTLDVLKTRAKYFGYELVITSINSIPDEEYFAAIFQYVGKDGNIEKLDNVINKLKQKNTIITIIADVMSLLLLKSPKDLGADIAVGSTQRFGIPMGFGGPHAAYFAFKDEFKRSSPGRIIGISKDKYGKLSYRMALQTREQHIRREKATSNICTSQALLANLSVMYAIYHGPKKLKQIAQRIHYYASVFASIIQKESSFSIEYDTFFDTILVNTKDDTEKIYNKALSKGVNLRKAYKDKLAVSFHELVDDDDVLELLDIFLDKKYSILEKIDSSLERKSFLRDDKILEHQVFNSYHSEHEMLRYLKRLENKDLSLTHSMIALGSCTMKLNATASMIPISWDAFNNIHPLAPKNQIAGYYSFLDDLVDKLKKITGFDDVSLQPNSGAQGEYTGLVTIRRFYESRGENNRNICLIPSSAHGTNPASAGMAGLKVITVKCDSLGNVDLVDLKTKADQYKDNLAVFMITYPSTHGVFEESIIDICKIIHNCNAQVYMDGANMNAQVGLISPSKLGADILHTNLHKTFAIPHGGGGPGMGPICMKKHLSPFKPKHVFLDEDTQDLSAVSAAPFGSASILPITWMYITMLGSKGLRAATKNALLNANYIASQLGKDFPILYTGKNSMVAHECIIDLRPIKEKIGITELDIAKRLMDFGFHSPTMSFPVAGTLMIEPTESENIEELDRFIMAMKQIKKEIENIENKIWTIDDNPLVNAPHTLHDISSHWDRAYSIEEAIFPLDYLKSNKYWPSVNRIDDVYGDKNFICSCQ